MGRGKRENQGSDIVKVGLGLLAGAALGFAAKYFSD